MKITTIESLHADGGWRSLDFLKISTDEGLVGWSEYNESFGGVGVSAAIAGLAPMLIGKDPRPWEAHVTLLSAVRRQAAGGVIQQAIGAIRVQFEAQRHVVHIAIADDSLRADG